jgi:DNA-binding Lrp family transcriptional regulator
MTTKTESYFAYPGKRKLLWIWREEMSADAKNIYEFMRYFARGDVKTWVAPETLGILIGKSVRTIQRRIKELIEQGFIEAVRERINGVMRTVYYFLNHPSVPKSDNFPTKEPSLSTAKHKIVPNSSDTKRDTGDAASNYNGQCLLSPPSPPQNGAADAAGESHENQKNQTAAHPKKDEEHVLFVRRRFGAADHGNDPQLFFDSRICQRLPGSGDRNFSRSSDDGAGIGQTLDSAILSSSSLAKLPEDRAWTDAKDYICASSPNLRSLLDQLIGSRLPNGVLSLDGPNAVVTGILERQHGARIAEALRKLGVPRHRFGVQSAELRQKIEAQVDAFEAADRFRVVMQAKEAKVVRQVQLDSLTPVQQFDHLVQEYPGKSSWWARQVYLRMHKKGELPSFSILISSVIKMKSGELWQKDCGRWIPHLSNYLLQHRWSD